MLGSLIPLQRQDSNLHSTHMAGALPVSYAATLDPLSTGMRRQFRSRARVQCIFNVLFCDHG